MSSRALSTALVLSGGGARGAYAVGVVAGLVEVLRDLPRQPFDVFSGTSVGAINVAWLAAHAHRTDMNVAGLVDHWEALELKHLLQLDLQRRLSAIPRAELLQRLWARAEGLLGPSLLDPSALERLVQEQLPFSCLHANVDSGLVRALIVPALEIASGRTSMFAEMAPGVEFRPSRDPRRVCLPGRLTAQHVLASAAIPLFFPARLIGKRYYCDGGLRFNTPVSPAIRAGAERICVVSLLHEGVPAAAQSALTHFEAAYPSSVFLLGKLLNALLLDPINYDLQVLARLNRMLQVLEETLDPEELARIQSVFAETRDLPYRRVQTLAIRPSRDLGALALEYARGIRVRNVSTGLLSWLSRLGDAAESDFLSFVMFDGEFARILIELGQADVRRREAEVRAFFEA